VSRPGNSTHISCLNSSETRTDSTASAKRAALRGACKRIPQWPKNLSERLGIGRSLGDSIFMLFYHRNVLMCWHTFRPVNGTSTSGPFLASSLPPGAHADPDTGLDWREAAVMIPRAAHRMIIESWHEHSWLAMLAVSDLLLRLHG
jgi:hypothetical protein